MFIFILESMYCLAKLVIYAIATKHFLIFLTYKTKFLSISRKEC